MAYKIKGIDVILYAKTQIGTDAFNAPVYLESPIVVNDVLVSPIGSQEALEVLDLHGKKATYTLAIPKGDTHDWEDCRVFFFGEDWHTFGFVTLGIEDNIPLGWNKKVQVEKYG